MPLFLSDLRREPDGLWCSEWKITLYINPIIIGLSLPTRCISGFDLPIKLPLQFRPHHPSPLDSPTGLQVPPGQTGDSVNFVLYTEWLTQADWPTVPVSWDWGVSQDARLSVLKLGRGTLSAKTWKVPGKLRWVGYPVRVCCTNNTRRRVCLGGLYTTPLYFSERWKTQRRDNVGWVQINLW